MVNPAAADTDPVIGTLWHAWHDVPMEWDVALTTGTERDGLHHVERALADGCDLLAVYGGDGTVRQVAMGLLASGAQLPLAIIPGGTANALSEDLGIPQELAAAARLLVDPVARIVPLNVCETDQGPFVLRCSFGLAARICEGVTREAKNRLGVFAYVLSTIQALREEPPVNYGVVIDGRAHEEEGVALVIANSGTLGLLGATMAPDVDPCDELLDVFVIRSMAGGLAALATGKTGLDTRHPAVRHWRGQSIQVLPSSPQPVDFDGDLCKRPPVHFKVSPQHVNVLVPAPGLAGAVDIT